MAGTRSRMKDQEKDNKNITTGISPKPPNPPPEAPEAPETAQADPLGAQDAPEASSENATGGESDATAHAPEGAAETPEDAAKTDAGDTDAGTDTEPSPEPDPEQLIAAARQEAEDNRDRFLRATAEMENYKRRIQKEHADSMRYAMSPLIRDIAATVDTLELAVAHAKKDPDNGGQGLVDGIEMVVKQIHEVFARFGVTRIETAGKTFNPELHEAMTVVETAEVPENQVIEEFQAGFKLHERVIRPARVSVSKPPA